MATFNENMIVDDVFIMEQVIQGIDYLVQNPIDIDMLMDDSSIEPMEEESEFDFSEYQVDPKDEMDDLICLEHMDDYTTSSSIESDTESDVKMCKSIQTKNTKKAYKIKKNQCVALQCKKRVYMDSICRVHYSRKYGIEEKLLIERCSAKGCEKAVYRDHFCKHCFIKVFPQFKCSIADCPNVAYRDSQMHTCKTNRRNKICHAKGLNGCKSKVDFAEDNFSCSNDTPSINEQLEMLSEYVHTMNRIFWQDNTYSAHV